MAFICMNHARPIGLFHRRVGTGKVGHMASQIASTSDLVRELDHRVNDRIDVWLRWRTSDDLLFVEVADGKTGDRFVVEVAKGQRPLDVFAHPYAYAEFRATP